MLRIRRFEEVVERAHKRGQLPGSVHLSIGQEAEVVGSCMPLRNTDYMTGNHRSHGHPIGKGAALGPLMAEIFGRAGGVCRGKGGSMHLADFGVGSLGESGVVGSAIPVATGAAFSAKVRNSGQVTLCFFGDGAANQGGLHESMNLAGIWDLPIVFLCENNQYAVTTPATESIAGGDLSRRAQGYGMPGVKVEDGQDVLAVMDAVGKAVERARSGAGPSLVEVLTFRFKAHSQGLLHASTAGGQSEREAWLSRDPIALFRTRLENEFGFAPPEIDALEHEVATEVEEALEFARSSPQPPAHAAYEDVFATRPNPMPLDRMPG